MKFWWKNFEQKTIQWRNGGPVFSDVNCCCELSFIYYGSTASGGDIAKIDNLDNTPIAVYDDTDGFIIGITSKASEDYIYFTSSNTDKIKRINSDGTGYSEIYNHPDVDGLSFFGISNNDTHIFFSDQLGNLHRIDLDGTNYTALSSGQWALGIHVYGSYIYIADENNNQAIMRCDLDGTNLTTIVNNASAGTPRDVYVDDNFIYWLDQKANSLVDIGRIKRSAHDGSGVTTLYGPIRTTFGTGNAGAICLWPAYNRIYFTWGQTLERIDLDGTNHTVVTTTGSVSLGGCHNCFVH